MTSSKYPGWDIAEVTEAGERTRVWVMINDSRPLWIRVREWKPGRFVALVFAGGHPVRSFERVCDAVDMAEF
jgi:hypothetical protein